MASRDSQLRDIRVDRPRAPRDARRTRLGSSRRRTHFASTIQIKDDDDRPSSSQTIEENSLAQDQTPEKERQQFKGQEKPKPFSIFRKSKSPRGAHYDVPPTESPESINPVEKEMNTMMLAIDEAQERQALIQNLEPASASMNQNAQLLQSTGQKLTAGYKKENARMTKCAIFVGAIFVAILIAVVVYFVTRE